MSKLVQYNERYEFENAKEEKTAQLLSIANVQYIKNQLYFERQRKENLVLDPSDIMSYVQAEAEIKGAIGAYMFLLDNHDSLIRGLEST